jgi:foldase protein PrsA
VRKFTNNITYLLLPVLIITFLCTGCSKGKAAYIVSINNEKLSMDDFLYDIYLVEKEGNQLEDYYQEKFGSSYWDFDYNGTTAREAAKSSVLTSVVMYDILSDRAEKNGIRLTREELSADEKTVNDILETYSKEAADRIGFTYDALKKAVDKRTLGDKYRTQLSKNFRIDEASVREGLNPGDYREYKTQCLYIPTFSIKDKEIIQFSEEEKAAALATITEALGELTKDTDFAAASQKATMTRSKVCNLEIWCEVFGKDRANIKRTDSNEMAAMLVKLGWVRLPKKERVKGYGSQFVFVPKSVPV